MATPRKAVNTNPPFTFPATAAYSRPRLPSVNDRRKHFFVTFFVKWNMHSQTIPAESIIGIIRLFNFKITAGWHLIIPELRHKTEASCQENRDRFFSKLFRITQKEQIFCEMLEFLRADILDSILFDVECWDNRDYDPDLKMSAFILAVDLCIYEGSGQHEHRRATRMVINNERLCKTLKNYILGRNKTEQVESYVLITFKANLNFYLIRNLVLIHYTSWLKIQKRLNCRYFANRTILHCCLSA